MADSFPLLRDSYLDELTFDSSFVSGFASYLQVNHLNDMYMGYCVSSEQVTCDPDINRQVACKIPCEYLPNYRVACMSNVIANRLY